MEVNGYGEVISEFSKSGVGKLLNFEMRADRTFSDTQNF